MSFQEESKKRFDEKFRECNAQDYGASNKWIVIDSDASKVKEFIKSEIQHFANEAIERMELELHQMNPRITRLIDSEMTFNEGLFKAQEIIKEMKS